VRQAAPRARATKRQHDFNPRKFQLFSLYAPAQLAAVTARTAQASGELKRGARATRPRRITSGETKGNAALTRWFRSALGATAAHGSRSHSPWRPT
jgi:hypothetical protein